MQNKLYLIPTTLGDTSLVNVVPNQIFDLINEIDIYIVENIRTARRYLKKLNIKKEIDELTFFELNKHTSDNDINVFFNSYKSQDIGLISEAGCPAVADPGADIVLLAHQNKIKVVPLVGASSILLSLMASGMNGQNFAFVGYIPIKKPERLKRLKFLEQRAKQEKQTQIFIEAPYRNMNLLDDILTICHQETLLCIASNITLDNESIQTKKIKDWKKNLPNIHKQASIFLLF